MPVQYATFGAAEITLVQAGADLASFHFFTPNVNQAEAAILAFQTYPAGNAKIRVPINRNVVLPPLAVNTGTRSDYVRTSMVRSSILLTPTLWRSS